MRVVGRRFNPVLLILSGVAALVVGCGGTSSVPTGPTASTTPATGGQLAVRMTGRFPKNFTAGLAGIYEPDDDGLVIDKNDECSGGTVNKPANAEQQAVFDNFNTVTLIDRGDDPNLTKMLDRVMTHLCSKNRKATVLITGQGRRTVVGDASRIGPLGPDVQQQLEQQKKVKQTVPGTLLQGPITMALPQPPRDDPLPGIEMLAADGGEFNLGEAPFDESYAGHVRNAFAVIEFQSVRAWFCECAVPQRHDSLPPIETPTNFEVIYERGPTATDGAYLALKGAIDAVLAHQKQAKQVFAPVL